MSRSIKLDHAAFQNLGAQRFHGAVSDDLNTLCAILAEIARACAYAALID